MRVSSLLCLSLCTAALIDSNKGIGISKVNSEEYYVITEYVTVTTEVTESQLLFESTTTVTDVTLTTQVTVTETRTSTGTTIDTVTSTLFSLYTIPVVKTETITITTFIDTVNAKGHFALVER